MIPGSLRGVEATGRTREDRLRRRVKRQGLRLVKSRRRDPQDADYGRYALIDPAGSPVLGRGTDGSYPMTLDDVEAWLTSLGRTTAGQDPGHRTADGAYEWTMLRKVVSQREPGRLRWRIWLPAVVRLPATRNRKHVVAR
jgi:hypothetical protein